MVVTIVLLSFLVTHFEFVAVVYGSSDWVREPHFLDFHISLPMQNQFFNLPRLVNLFKPLDSKSYLHHWAWVKIYAIGSLWHIQLKLWYVKSYKSECSIKKA